MCSHFVSPNHSKQMQSGFALVTALIFLVIMLLLGVTVVGSTSSEEKMAQNARDFDIGFAAAEAGVRDAEMHIDGSYQWPYNTVSQGAFSGTCTNGLCNAEVPLAFAVDQQDFFGATTPGSNSVIYGAVTGQPTLISVSTQPRYMIEMLCADIAGESVVVSATGCPRVFRITVKGQGRLPNTLVTVQEMYRSQKAPIQ